MTGRAAAAALTLAALNVALHGQAPVFRAEVRLVEVYFTVQDKKGTYIDGLTSNRFRVLDDGTPQAIERFETEATELSCAVLLDTSGSMRLALPAIKNAVSRFLDDLRPADAVAIYAFDSTLHVVADFTTDKAAAKRAMQRTRAAGGTALYDAIVQAATEVARRNGNKVVLVFTDGSDNASALRPGAVSRSARKTGVRLYTIAEGGALKSTPLMALLRQIASSSGGLSYEAKKPEDVAGIFSHIVSDMKHMYTITYKQPAATLARWRKIEISVLPAPEYAVRGKEGYFPD